MTGAVAMTVFAATLAGWFVDRGDTEQSRALDGAGRPDAAACTVRYAVRGAVGGRSSTIVTITNTGPSTITDWRLSFPMPAEHRLVRGWGGQWRQSGESMQVSGGELAAGTAVEAGFDAAHEGESPLPDRFQLNDTACRAVLLINGQPRLPDGSVAVPVADRPADNDGKVVSTDAEGVPAAGSAADSNEARGVAAGRRANAGGGNAAGGNAGGGRPVQQRPVQQRPVQQGGQPGPVQEGGPPGPGDNGGGNNKPDKDDKDRKGRGGGQDDPGGNGNGNGNGNRNGNGNGNGNGKPKGDD